MYYLRLLFIVIIFSNLSFAKTYNIDKTKSNAHFFIKNIENELIDGEFKNLKGSIQYDEKTKKLKKLNFNIDVSSLNTSNPNIDDYIKSQNILDIDQFPKIFISSTKMEKNFIYADLKIKNVVKNLKFEIEDFRAKHKTIILKLKASTKKNYFDLSWNEFSNEKQLTNDDEIDIIIYLVGFTQAKKYK